VSPTTEAGDLAGKVALVTGAASDIGRAAAMAFAQKGASVVVADVAEDGNQETARMIEDQGGCAPLVGRALTSSSGTAFSSR
jgi:NAD(P)-dependent dehydrogenase (short-subunit alcohol dehydrogenase family)